MNADALLLWLELISYQERHTAAVVYHVNTAKPEKNASTTYGLECVKDAGIRIQRTINVTVDEVLLFVHRGKITEHSGIGRCLADMKIR